MPIIYGDTSIEGNLVVTGLTVSLLKITTGASSGYVLTSDSNGNATWQFNTSAGLSGSGISNYLTKWYSISSLTSSIIYDNDNSIYLGKTSSYLDQFGFNYTTSITNLNSNTHSVGLSIETGGANTTNIGLFNYQNVDSQNLSNNYGIYNSSDVNNCDSVYGIHSEIIGTNSNSITRGISNLITMNSTDNITGIYNNISNSGNLATIAIQNLYDGTGSSFSYGLYSPISRANYYSYGVYMPVNWGGGGTLYGVYISGGINTGTSSGTVSYYYAEDEGSAQTKYAFHCNISGNSLSKDNYGAYLEVSGATDSNYGIYTKLSETLGKNYGLYIDSYSASESYGVVVERGTSIFNNSGEDFNFTVKGSLDSSLLVTNASANVIGVGGYSSNTKFSISTTSTSHIVTLGIQNSSGTSSGTNYAISASSTTTNTGTNYGLYVNTANANTNYGVVVNNGTSVFNFSGSADSDFRIAGDTNPNLFFVDASTDRVGIKTSFPTYDFTVVGTVSSSTGFNTNGLNGWSGTFSADGQIVTVTGGIITSVT